MCNREKSKEIEIMKDKGILGIFELWWLFLFV